MGFSIDCVILKPTSLSFFQYFAKSNTIIPKNTGVHYITAVAYISKRQAWGYCPTSPLVVNPLPTQRSAWRAHGGKGEGSVHAVLKKGVAMADTSPSRLRGVATADTSPRSFRFRKRQRTHAARERKQ